MFSYRTITLSEDATVTCAHSERLLVVQRVHNARAAVTCGGRSWLCTGFRESRRSEEAKAGGCGTGERAHWFLWCLSLSFSLCLWSTWMAGVSTMEAGITHNHTCRDPHQGYITHMSHTDILMWGLRGSCSFKATLVFSRFMTLKWSNTPSRVEYILFTLQLKWFPPRSLCSLNNSEPEAVKRFTRAKDQKTFARFLFAVFIWHTWTSALNVRPQTLF